ncbi:MAG: DUF91 domain-containing protein, partial [Proteobacteria bacterium]|nr:DUF91 domain-containing protein [Pseudomonadota bacterium]
MNLLIPFVYLYDHDDPLFKEFTYGDVGTRAKKLKNSLKKGDYIFFHTSIGSKKYITAYYVIDRVLDTIEAIKDKNIMAKYKNPHLERRPSKHERYGGDVLVFGDPITSRTLDRPLLFDKVLARKLSLDIKFPKGRTETQAIGSATRAWRELTENDVDVLLSAIKLSELEGQPIETILSTDEVTEIIEKDIENYIEKNPSLIGESLTLMKRQLDTPVGRIDLLFEDKKGNLIVAELKLNKIGREAVNQLRRYMNWVKK